MLPKAAVIRCDEGEGRGGRGLFFKVKKKKEALRKVCHPKETLLKCVNMPSFFCFRCNSCKNISQLNLNEDPMASATAATMKEAGKHMRFT